MTAFIDMHCDALLIPFLSGQKNADLYASPGMVDFQRLKTGNALVQCFAIPLPSPDLWGYINQEPITDEKYISILHGYFTNSLKQHPNMISPAKNCEDILKNISEGKISAILTIEDGRAVNSKLENIQKFYDMDVRILTLTWNHPNCLGYPNSKDSTVMSRGLTDFGKEAVNYMQNIGMVIDVSHLSDGGFYDVASICKKPFIASHSNCRALCSHQRNLTDEMLHVLGDKGGVAGLNFGPEFLNTDLTCKDSTAAIIAKHARHMANVGGIDVVGIGTDFDGIGGNLEISDCSKMSLLDNALEKEGFTANEREKIFQKNVMRVFHESMK